MTKPQILKSKEWDIPVCGFRCAAECVFHTQQVPFAPWRVGAAFQHLAFSTSDCLVTRTSLLLVSKDLLAWGRKETQKGCTIVL